MRPDLADGRSRGRDCRGGAGNRGNPEPPDVPRGRAPRVKSPWDGTWHPDPRPRRRLAPSELDAYQRRTRRARRRSPPTRPDGPSKADVSRPIGIARGSHRGAHDLDLEAAGIASEDRVGPRVVVVLRRRRRGCALRGRRARRTPAHGPRSTASSAAGGTRAWSGREVHSSRCSASIGVTISPLRARCESRSPTAAARRWRGIGRTPSAQEQRRRTARWRQVAPAEPQMTVRSRDAHRSRLHPVAAGARAARRPRLRGSAPAVAPGLRRCAPPPRRGRRTAR